MSMTVPTPIMSLADQLKSDEKIADLNDMSHAARAERAKIQRQLQLARDAEESSRGSTSKLARLRRAIKGSHPSTADGDSQSPSSHFGRWALVALLLQALVFFFLLRYAKLLVTNSAQRIDLFLAIHRWAASRAEHLFLTTHFDPFFPAIYSPPAPSLSPSSPSGRLWKLLTSITGATMPPPPPPPTHVLFGLLPRASIPHPILKLVDGTSNFFTAHIRSSFSFLDSDMATGGGGAWVPS